MTFPVQHPRLLLLPALAADLSPSGGFVLTRKFITGVEQYVERWPGPVTVAVDRAEKPTTNLDQVEVRPGELAFELCWLPDTAAEREQLIRQASLALVTMVDKNLAHAEAADQVGVPVVLVTEYSQRTRRQIIWSETANPVLRWRREWYNRQCEHRFTQAVRRATGVQCNGTPTYEVYRQLNPRTLLYFDSRVRTSQLASQSIVTTRTQRLMQGFPIRLAFSGRLIAMKGADHLAHVAAELRKRSVPFRLDICGGGPLESRMRRDVERLGIHSDVHFRGVLDFEKELLPMVAREVDLFVCCHRQGDPSCTYLETMSCGTPIAGYDNEALRGVVRASGSGWLSPMDKPDRLAAVIADLSRDRPALAAASIGALSFAAGHTLESTMQARVDHLMACLESRHRIGRAS